MKQNLVDTLKDVVLSYDPARGTHLGIQACALARLRHTREEWMGMFLDEVAMAFGFTKQEACGIMNGWDAAAGYARTMYRNDGNQEYERAQAFGAELFEACLAKGTAQRALRTAGEG